MVPLEAVLDAVRRTSGGSAAVRADAAATTVVPDPPFVDQQVTNICFSGSRRLRDRGR
jgi:hypothetical protein